MIKKIIGIYTLIFATIVFSATEAKAQYVGTSPFMTYSNNIFVNSNMHLFFQKRWRIASLRAAGKHQLADAMEGRVTSGGQKQSGAPSAEPGLRRVPLARTSFKPTGKTIVPDELTDDLQDISAEEKAAVRELFSELLKNYDQMLTENKETRLRNNVAGAAVFALLVSHSVLTNGSELSEKQTESLLQDINALLASADSFKKLSAREQQKMYETFAVFGGLTLMFYRQGEEEGDREKIAQGQDLAKFIISQFFDQPIDEISFTDEGVRF